MSIVATSPRIQKLMYRRAQLLIISLRLFVAQHWGALYDLVAREEESGISPEQLDPRILCGPHFINSCHNLLPSVTEEGDSASVPFVYARCCICRLALISTTRVYYCYRIGVSRFGWVVLIECIDDIRINCVSLSSVSLLLSLPSLSFFSPTCL